MNSWFDSALLLYGLCIFFVSSCLYIWIYWWFISETRSDMFAMVGLLLASIDLTMIMQFYARWQFVFYPNDCNPLLNTDIWAYRVSLELIVVMWFFSWATGRFFGQRTGLSTKECVNGIKKDMFNGFEKIDAKIVAGELRFEGHSHEDGKIIVAVKLVAEI